MEPIGTKPIPTATSGPVPLMALGEISPPEMLPRTRQPQGQYRDRDRDRDRDNRESHGANRSGVPPRLQRFAGGERGGRPEQQSNRGGKKKGLDGKPQNNRSNDPKRDGAQDEHEMEQEAEAPKTTPGNVIV
jgi:hypothetical protein